MHRNPQEKAIFRLRAKASWPTLVLHAKASGCAKRFSSRGFGSRVGGSGGASRRSVKMPGAQVSIALHDPAKPAGCLRAPVGVEDRGRPARLRPSGKVHRVRLRSVSVARSGTGERAGFVGPRPGKVGCSLVGRPERSSDFSGSMMGRFLVDRSGPPERVGCRSGSSLSA